MDGISSEGCKVNEDSKLPAWLADHDAFLAHLDEQLADENPHGKGLRFVNFALTLLPRVPELSEFTGFELNTRVSHDKGVDILTATNENDRQLLIQSKFRIRRVDEIDTILSLFEAFEAERQALPEPTLFDLLGSDIDGGPIFAIAYGEQDPEDI